MPPENLTWEYIGDGVYAAFDGYQIWIKTPRENGDHYIALERETLSALIMVGKQHNLVDASGHMY